MTRVSTITPSFNTKSYIKGFLKNVEAQTHKDLEVVLDHNEPSAKEIKLVEKFNKKNNTIRHIIVEKVDPIGTSMNRCIDNSTGEYLCIWNVDDLRTTNSIEMMANILDDKSDIDIVIGKYTIVRKFKSKKGKVVDESSRDHKDFMEGMLLGPFFMFRRSLLEKTGKFDEQLIQGNDYDLAMRLVREGKYYCLNKNIGYYLDEGKGLSTKPDSIQPLERTLIEMRYNVRVLDETLINQAKEKYDLDHLYFDSKKHKVNY
jgi:GT2 family glycosyltransferase